MTKEELAALINDAISAAKADWGSAKKAEDEATEAKVKAQFEEYKKTYEEKIAQLEETLTELKKPVDKKDLLGGEEERGEDPKGGFKNFTEFTARVKDAAINPGRIDERLFKYESKDTKAAGTGLLVGDDEYGGYLIPAEFRQEIIAHALETTDIINQATIIPMGTNSIKIPVLNDADHSGGTTYGGVTFYWLGEISAITESRPKLEMLELRLKKVAGMVYVSNDMLQYSPVSIQPFLQTRFSEALAWTLDGVFINGVGAGQPSGILTADCLVTQTPEAGHTATCIEYDDVIKMYARMWQHKNAQWYANSDCLPSMAQMNIAAGAGGAVVWMPSGGAANKPYNTLLGHKVNWTEHCQTVGTKGDIYFADWSQYYIGRAAGADEGAKFDMSIHLKFEYNQTAFRLTFDIDGQPAWRAAQTPRYSSDTKGPFVCVDTRS